MEITSFHHIIDFAVEREKEAVQFYSSLQKTAPFEAHKSLLQELENMEKGHILTLEKIRTKQLGIKVNRAIDNLKISDYLVVDDNLKPDSYLNILLIAMKREEKSHLLYLHLADNLAGDDPELSNLFSRLAAEEAVHKNKFEKLYDEDILKDN